MSLTQHYKSATPMGVSHLLRLRYTAGPLVNLTAPTFQPRRKRRVFHHFHTPNSTPTITIDLLAVSLPATCLITAPCLTEMYHFW